MNNKNTVGMEFVAVLAITFVVLISLVTALFVVTNDTVDNSSDVSDESVTTSGDTDVVDVVLNTTPLFPTQQTRTSYIIPQSNEVKTISDTYITSEHAILVDLSSFSSVAEKRADEKIYPASMTKVMSLIVACERVVDLNEKLTVTAEIADFAEKNDGSGIGLKVGESYTVEDLLFLVSYKSDTIASLLIADYIAGSESAFVELMNDKATELGLVSTKFAKCTGLYDDNNYTTCREMASIMAYALDNEMVYRCLSEYHGRSMMIDGIKCTAYSGWYSQRFSDNPKFTGGKIIAGKTGYTDESGYTLVSCAEIDGKRYINVIVTRTDKTSTVKVQEGPSADQVKYIYKNYK